MRYDGHWGDLIAPVGRFALDAGIAALQNGTNQVFWNGEPTCLLFTNGYDPTNPFQSPNAYDPNYEAELTNELILGVEHALLPEFVVGLTMTMRNISDIQQDCPLVGFGGQNRGRARLHGSR